MIMCDAVKTMGIHNGVARIEFIRLLPDGSPVPSLELLLPAAAVVQIIKALQSIQQSPPSSTAGARTVSP